jgi:hypothetical protein
MLSNLLYLVSLVSGGDHFGVADSRIKRELMDGEAPTGALIVKMGPVMNVRVVDVKVITGHEVASLPAISKKGSLFEAFSHNRLYAVRYGK